jgi:hypothetical protein
MQLKKMYCEEELLIFAENIISALIAFEQCGLGKNKLYLALKIIYIYK